MKQLLYLPLHVWRLLWTVVAILSIWIFSFAIAQVAGLTLTRNLLRAMIIVFQESKNDQQSND